MDERLEKIVVKANELGHLLKQNEIIQRFTELAQQMENSEASRTLLEEFAKASQEYQMRSQSGEPVSEEDQRRIQELEEKVRGDELIVQYMATQSYYLQIMTLVNQAITDPQGPPPRESNIVLPGEDSGIVLP